MKKLGIAIKITVQGSGEPIKINGGPWTSKIVDIRENLKHVPGLEGNPGRSVTFLSFSPEGAYITVARCSDGRSLDNVAGWIFVPSDIRISGNELEQIVEEVRRIIFLSQLPQQGMLEQLFSKAYELKSCPSPYASSPKNGRFAKRDVTPATPLNVLLGDAIYQTAYSQFQSIFLEEFPGQIVDVTDLSGQPLERMITLLPPSPEELSRAGVSLTFVSNGQPFDKPQLVSRGSSVELQAVRRGYEPKKINVKVETDGQRVDIRKILFQKRIAPDAFSVSDSRGNTLRPGSYKVTVNGRDLGNGLFFTEAELTSANVSVRSSAGESASLNTSLFNLPVYVRLSENRGPVGQSNAMIGKAPEGMNFRMELANGEWGNVTVNGRNLGRGYSPLKGYALDGNNLVLQASWKDRIIGFVVGFLCAGAIVGILALCGVFKPKVEEVNTIATVDPTEVEANSGDTTEPQVEDKEHNEEAAIAYLDQNAKWNRDEMEQFPLLKGLFDDLNSFNFKALHDLWESKLIDSKKFTQLMGHVAVNERNGWNVRSRGPQFLTEPGDVVITVQSYMNWINRECSTDKREPAKTVQTPNPKPVQTQQPSTKPKDTKGSVPAGTKNSGVEKGTQNQPNPNNRRS